MIINNQPVVRAGEAFSHAKKALIMLHGRGDTAQNFVRLAEELNISDCAVLALQAIQNAWYPRSFLAPLSQNEPQLSLSLSGLAELVHDLEGLKFTSEDIFFLGFSQGACLTLEFCARHAKRYGGIIAFTGGLLGDEVDTANYAGDFMGTPIFLGASSHDPHVPEERIDKSEVVLSAMGASVTKKIYPGLGHTINQNELIIANTILQGTLMATTTLQNHG